MVWLRTPDIKLKISVEVWQKRKNLVHWVANHSQLSRESSTVSSMGTSNGGFAGLVKILRVFREVSSLLFSSGFCFIFFRCVSQFCYILSLERCWKWRNFYQHVSQSRKRQNSISRSFLLTLLSTKLDRRLIKLNNFKRPPDKTWNGAFSNEWFDRFLSETFFDYTFLWD